MSDPRRAATPPLSAAAPGPAVADHHELRLTAADGNVLMAFEAHAARPTRRGMVILPNVRGLHRFYEDLADRFAEAGFEAITLDYYGRSAGEGDRGDAFDWPTYKPLTSPEMVAADVRVCVDRLRADPDHPVGPIFTVGFSWGGAHSLRQSAEGWGVAGAIGFYTYQPMTLVGPWIPRLGSPLLMLQAGADPQHEHDEFLRALRARGVTFESHLHEGAPHNFFDQSYAAHPRACAESWEQVLEFTRTLAPPAR